MAAAKDERPPPSILQDARERSREGHEGDEGADPATRFGDFQARVGKDDDVPLAQDGYSEDLERVLGRAGGKALGRESDGVEDDLGGRDHEQEHRERYRQDSQIITAERPQHQARQHDDQRQTLNEELGCQEAEEKSSETADHDEQTAER
jgi:hypothetical protein